ncbi:MAG: hypothetical protein ACTSXZ_06830, partial [Alphaproteobacteria bacterium]
RTRRAAGKAAAMPGTAMTDAATAAAGSYPANQQPDGSPAATGPRSESEARTPVVTSSGSFVAPRPDAVAKSEPRRDESVTSVFGAATPAPEASDVPEPTAQDVFGVRKPKSEESPEEAAPAPPEPAAEPEEADPGQEAAVPQPQVADEEPAPRPWPPVSGGSEPAEESGESSESEPPAQN